MSTTIEEIPITLRLDKNIAELLRILSIVYNEYPIPSSEILNKFCTKEITKIVIALVKAPPNPEDLPENFKQMLKNMLNESTADTINDNNNTGMEDLK